MSKEFKHNSKSEKKSFPNKWAFIIGGAVLAVAAAVIIIFVIIGNQNKELNLPNDEKIISDLNSVTEITTVKVGKKPLSFKVTTIEKSDEKVSEDKRSYTFSAKVKRANKIYEIEPVSCKVSYEKKDKDFELRSADVDKDSKVVLKPIAGADKKDALKRAQKTYKNAKYKERKTNLEKGTDNIIFTVDDKEYEGTASVNYKFDSSKGWLFSKLDDSKVKFKKGVTHKENGLYTNSAVKNILYLGIDSDEFSGRSDVMMLISVDSNTGKIKQTSFMRDNWFEIPGYGSNKLNAAYAFGGADLTVKTIQDTFGIKIDNYVATNFSTFKSIINALGGIDVDITSDEAGYINWQINRNGQTSSVGEISESGGVTHLNGQQALWLCRDRGSEQFSGDDFMRTGRQRRVIQSLVSTYKDYTPVKVLATLKSLLENVQTDMTAADLKWFADRSPKFFGYKFSERCVPTDGEWQSGESSDGQWIISLNDFEGLKSEIQKDIYEDLK